MGDGHTSKPLKEEIFDEGDDKCVQNFEVEKLEHNEAMEFQSCSASTIQEAGGMDHCIAGMHEEHEKKPNKKLEKCLPCPRCGSFDTKFCYFNNYNVNQPRHFCRKCQRYWTAGGVLRNVPKGAGRRRSKSNTTHQKHGVLLDAKSLGCNAYDMAGSYAKTGFLYAQTTLVPLDVGQLVSEDGLSASSTMLSFGQQEPLCDVMATHSSSMQEPNMAKQTSKGQYPSPVCTNAASDRHALEQERHGTHSISSREAVSILPTAPRLLEGLGMAFHYLQEKDEKNVSLCSRIENMESNDPVKQEAMLVPSNCTSTHSDSGNTADDKATHMPSDSAKVSEVSLSLSLGNGLPGAMWIHPPWLVMPPGPLTWNWGSAYWHMPWFLAAVASSSSSGQHESQSVEAGPHDDKGYLWTPKTLNINDPVEAAQSSIWKTLGLDKAAGSSADSKKPFQGEAGIQDVGKWSSSSQHCNPAALSRSLAFNETA